jgi:hypothetical protein
MRRCFAFALAVAGLEGMVLFFSFERDSTSDWP